MWDLELQEGGDNLGIFNHKLSLRKNKAAVKRAAKAPAIPLERSMRGEGHDLDQFMRGARNR
jgi:hypothetical protein